MLRIEMRTKTREMLEEINKRLNANLLMYHEKYRPMIEYFYPVITMAESGLFTKKMKLSIDKDQLTHALIEKFAIVSKAWNNLVSIKEDEEFANLMCQTQEQFPKKGELNALFAFFFIFQSYSL